jgi:hypothetical protein
MMSAEKFTFVFGKMSEVLQTLLKYKNFAVSENVTCQQDLHSELSRTVSQLSLEATDAADKAIQAQTAVSVRVAADSSSQLESLRGSLDSFRALGVANSQLTDSLAAGIQARGQEQQLALADMQAETAQWAARFADETTASKARTEEACSKAIRAIEQNEKEIAAVLEAAAGAAQETSGRLETAVAADISGPTTRFCETKAADVGEVMSLVESFVKEGLQEDRPTGATPGRLERSYPRYLAATSPHARITER